MSCILIWYSRALLNSHNSSSHFLLNSLRFFYIDNHIVCKYSQLYIFCSNLYGIFFLLPIALAETSSVIWNRSRESRHPCIVPDLSGKDLSLLLNVMLSVGFS